MGTENDRGVAVWFGLNAAGIVFLGVWVNAIASNDWLLGLAFGWIPAAIIAVIAGLIAHGFIYGVSGLLTWRRHGSDASSAGSATEL